MFHLAGYLSARGVLALSTASWPFLTTTASSNALWRCLLHREMAWAADVVDELANELLQNDQRASPRETATEMRGIKALGTDYKALMLWLDDVVKPVEGVGAPWVHLANRRRIWRVSQIVADRYWIELCERDGGHSKDKRHEWPGSLLGNKYQRPW
jgi:hypothetical protein